MTPEEQLEKYRQERTRLLYITTYVASQHTELKEQLKAINILIKEKKAKLSKK